MHAKEREWQDPGEIRWRWNKGHRTGQTRGHREFERTVSEAQVRYREGKLKTLKGNEAERRRKEEEKGGPGHWKGKQN